VKNTDHGEKSIASQLGFKRQIFVGEQDRGQQEIPPDYVEVMQGEKVCGYKKKSELFTQLNLDKYKVTTSVMAGNIYLDDNGMTLGIVPCNILKPNQVPKGSYPVIMYFNTENEAKSFKSYYESKLVSFLFYFGACGSTLTKEFYRFIPDPIKFDHIFTDEELYKKYNLTEEEINIIESVIKERK
jgi:site-specific DNA-methyltransferase (adenine-specific)